MINVNWSTLLFQILNFLAMVFILTRFFFRPVLRILDERSKRVTSALDDAQQREKEAAELQAEYERKVAESQEMVMTMRQQAQEELEATRRRVLTEMRNEIQAMRDKAEQSMDEARQQAIQEHRRHLGQLATTLSQQLMREAGGETFQKATFEQFLRQLAALPEEQYHHVVATDDQEAVRVQLVSARQLEDDDRSRIESLAQEMAHKPIEVSYRVDPELVAGATMRFGDVLIDGSLAGQLETLNARYLSGVEQRQT
jgi:F-type H+-transporting ATPase subunit b